MIIFNHNEYSCFTNNLISQIVLFFNNITNYFYEEFFFYCKKKIKTKVKELYGF